MPGAPGLPGWSCSRRIHRPRGMRARRLRGQRRGSSIDRSWLPSLLLVPMFLSGIRVVEGTITPYGHGDPSGGPFGPPAWTSAGARRAASVLRILDGLRRDLVDPVLVAHQWC